MPTASHVSRIVVTDSGRPGTERLPHSMYAIVYVPTWLLLREQFDWSNMPKTLSLMKEYFISSKALVRPIVAQRCLYSMKAINIYHPGRYPLENRQLYEAQYALLLGYLAGNPVVAWDWIVTWTECREIAKVYPEELVRLYRKFRSKYETKRARKPELLYFLYIAKQVCDEYNIDTERK